MQLLDRRVFRPASRRNDLPIVMKSPVSPNLRHLLRCVAAQADEGKAVMETAGSTASSDGASAGNIVETKSLSSGSISKPLPMPVSSETLPMMWQKNAEAYGDFISLEDPHRIPGKIIKVTYRELVSQMMQLAAGMQALGLQKGSRVSIFSENSSRWIVTDQAVMMNGAVAAVRGSTAPQDELGYIARHSESVALMLQDIAALKKMAPEINKSDFQSLKFIMIMWADAEALKKEIDSLGLNSVEVVTFEEVMALGESRDFSVVQTELSDLATLCYTSGTTGHPKGVMLTHANIMYQVKNLRYFVPINPGETVMSLLPPWHIYERSAAYFMLGHGLRVVYSTIPKFGQDLATYKPDHFVAVPLVLDTLHGRVMHKLKATAGLKGKVAMFLMTASIACVRNQRIIDGLALEHALKHNARSLATLILAVLYSIVLKPLHFLAQKIVFGKVRDAIGVTGDIVCGGGSLAPHLDDFFEAIGLKLLNGWGLTETSPVLACRRAWPEGQNVRGTTGLPTPGTSIRFVDPETLKDVEDGQKGLILAKGPGVMRGYLNDEEATKKAFRAGPGWFDTGDLGYRVPYGVPGAELMAGHIALTGRAKDTIVMSTGKNVEPEPIENAIASSPLIKHCIVIGQDKRDLGALVFPDYDALAAIAKAEAEAAARGDSAPASAPAAPATPTDSTKPELPSHIPEDPKEMEDMFLEEVVKLNHKRLDFHQYESITHISIMSRPLCVDEGTLTRTMKPRRPEIYKVYSKEVDALLKKLR